MGRSESALQIVSNQKIAKSRRNRKSVTCAGAFEHQIAGLVIAARVEFSADHLQSYDYCLHCVFAPRLHVSNVLRPIDLVSAKPPTLTLLRRKEPYWDFEIVAAAPQFQDACGNNHEHLLKNSVAEWEAL
jgi:hypothetical protein